MTKKRCWNDQPSKLVNGMYYFFVLTEASATCDYCDTRGTRMQKLEGIKNTICLERIWTDGQDFGSLVWFPLTGVSLSLSQLHSLGSEQFLQVIVIHVRVSLRATMTGALISSECISVCGRVSRMNILQWYTQILGKNVLFWFYLLWLSLPNIIHRHKTVISLSIYCKVEKSRKIGT